MRYRDRAVISYLVAFTSRLPGGAAPRNAAKTGGQRYQLHGPSNKTENTMVDFKDDIRIDVTKHEGDRDWAGTGRYLSIEAPSIPINSSLSDTEVKQAVRSMLTDICGSASFYSE